MTNEEFSNQFSTLLNSYGSVARFGEQASRQEIVLDEYEKSTFLTQAQDIIVKSYFDGRLNPQGQGFDDSERRQIDFSSLIKVSELTEHTSTGRLFDERSVIFQLPMRTDNSADVLFILNEKLLKKKTVEGSTSVETEYVIRPISYLEYDREMSKPYTKPLKKQAWRLFQNQSTGFDVLSEIIPRVELNTNESWAYRVRYVRRPQPIVLEDLTDGLSLDGVSEETECELHPSLHMDILLKAVELAYSTRSGRLVQQEAQNNQQEQSR